MAEFERRGSGATRGDASAKLPQFGPSIGLRSQSAIARAIVDGKPRTHSCFFFDGTPKVDTIGSENGPRLGSPAFLGGRSARTLVAYIPFSKSTVTMPY